MAIVRAALIFSIHDYSKRQLRERPGVQGLFIGHLCVYYMGTRWVQGGYKVAQRATSETNTEQTCIEYTVLKLT